MMKCRGSYFSHMFLCSAKAARRLVFHYDAAHCKTTILVCASLVDTLVDACRHSHKSANRQVTVPKRDGRYCQVPQTWVVRLNVGTSLGYNRVTEHPETGHHTHV